MLLVWLVNVNVSLNVGRECFVTSNEKLFVAPVMKHRIGCRLFSLTFHRTDRSEEGGSCSTSSQLSQISVGDFIRAVRIHGRARPPPTALFGPIPILAIVFSQRIHVRKNVYLVLHLSLRQQSTGNVFAADEEQQCVAASISCFIVVGKREAMHNTRSYLIA